MNEGIRNGQNSELQDMTETPQVPPVEVKDVTAKARHTLHSGCFADLAVLPKIHGFSKKCILRIIGHDMGRGATTFRH